VVGIWIDLGKTPTWLNTLRLPPGAKLRADFTITLAQRSSSGTAMCNPTPSDVAGPFHLPPENVPNEFPERATACLPDPSCAACNESVTEYGVPMVLQGHIRSSAGCTPLRGSSVIIDIWQADPSGNYWDDNSIWSGAGRRLQSASHAYNCRAHLSGGEFAFDTVLPGHYVAGASWRPRHIHIRVQAPGHTTLVSQLYFVGDPFLGEADRACSACQSDHPDLLVPLNLTQPISASSASGSVWNLSWLNASRAPPQPPPPPHSATLPSSSPAPAPSPVPVPSPWPPLPSSPHTHTVAVEFIAAGSPADFDAAERASILASLSTALGLGHPPPGSSLTLRAASVHVAASFPLPSAAAAQRALSYAQAADLANASTLESVLADGGVSVAITATPIVASASATPPVSPPSLPSLDTASRADLSSPAVVAAVVGGFGGLTLLALCVYMLRRTRRRAPSPSKPIPIESVGSRTASSSDRGSFSTP